MDLFLQLNYTIALSALLLEIILALAILWFIFAQGNFLAFILNFENIKNTFFNNWSKLFLVLIFVLSAMSSVMTLVYSEIFGVIPCALCWFERVFMYGIVIISATALCSGRELEQRGIMKYILNFSILGAAVSLYHHILQMTATLGSHLPCPASGADCTKLTIFEFGHITFPWLAFLVFSTFIFIYFVNKKLNK